MLDVVVIGGGVIGLSAACELAGQGCRVRLLDQSQPGQEASWAGAGMLPPGGLDGPPSLEVLLRAHSYRLWADWEASLVEATGIDIGFRRCGAIEVRPMAEASILDREIETWKREGVPVEPLAAADLRERYPGVAAENLTAYWLADYAQVRNPRLLKALVTACLNRGVEISNASPVVQIELAEGRVEHIRTPDEAIAADRFVLAAGAWSGRVLNGLGIELRIEPVRGQMVLLEQRPLPLPCIMQSGLQYIVPRADGRILIGATEEHAGFEKRNTAAGMSELLVFGQRLIPALAGARFERAWAGLRPWRPGGLPFIGYAPGIDNLVIAAGHFRAGLQLSPITATLIRQLICNQPTTISRDLLATAHVLA